jgi:hypothetical protein
MISLLTGTLGLAVAALIIWMVRKDHLHVNHGFGWIIAAVGFALMGFAPGVVDAIAAYLGVAYPPTLALTLAVIVLVIKTLLMDIERSRLEARNQRLTQRLAIIETDLKQQSKRTTKDGGDKETNSAQDHELTD